MGESPRNKHHDTMALPVPLAPKFDMHQSTPPVPGRRRNGRTKNLNCSKNVSITKRDLTATLAETESDSVAKALNKGTNAGKHSELFTAGKELGLEREDFLRIIAGAVTRNFPEHFRKVLKRIEVLSISHSRTLTMRSVYIARAASF